jgi:hypothetical protein
VIRGSESLGSKGGVLGKYLKYYIAAMTIAIIGYFLTTFFDLSAGAPVIHLHLIIFSSSSFFF